MHCRGEFQSVPVSLLVSRTRPRRRITVTTQNTAPTPFRSSLKLNLTSASFANIYFGSFSTSRHRHRLQQTEGGAPRARAATARLFTTGRRAASCVSPPLSPPRPRPTSPSRWCAVRLLLGVISSESDGRAGGTGVLLEWGKEKIAIALCRSEGERASDACTCHRSAATVFGYSSIASLSLGRRGECVSG